MSLLPPVGYPFPDAGELNSFTTRPLQKSLLMGPSCSETVSLFDKAPVRLDEFSFSTSFIISQPFGCNLIPMGPIFDVILELTSAPFSSVNPRIDLGLGRYPHK